MIPIAKYIIYKLIAPLIIIFIVFIKFIVFINDMDRVPNIRVPAIIGLMLGS